MFSSSEGNNNQQYIVPEGIEIIYITLVGGGGAGVVHAPAQDGQTQQRQRQRLCCR